MSWRIVHVTDVEQLSLNLDSLRIRKGDTDIKIPLGDIFSLVIEDLTCKLTSRLMVELSKNNILVLLCNQQHLPETLMLPVQGHYGQYKRMTEQINWKKEFKGDLWKQIIGQKIMNQILVMEKQQVEQHRINKLFSLQAELKPFDSTNSEAQAAKIYFNSFFGEDYYRGNTELVENSALNYGYTIMNSAITRTISAKGLIPGLGIHHEGERNPFNLSSDIIEPFRPVVDLFVISNPPEDYLTKDYRLKLINLMHAQVRINGKMQTVIRAIDIFISSMFEFFETGDSNLIKLPSIKKIQFHES